MGAFACRLGWTAAGVACSLLAACATTTGVDTGASRATTVPTRSVNVTALPSAVATGLSSSPAGGSKSGTVDKALVIMEENHSIGQVFPSHMPYLWSLAQRYGRATSWSGVSHPSLPNYVAVFGGSSFNDPQDCAPGPGCEYPGPSVFGQVSAAGGTARAYEESMPAPCDHGFVGEYDVNHNPWAYFPSEAAQCRADDVPSGTPSTGALASDVAAGTLPTVGLLTPNLQHDGHDGTLAQADAWLGSWLPAILAGPDWRAGRLAVVVVFDEGETTETVPFVILAPGVSGVVLTAPLNHYSLTLFLDEVAGLPPLRKASGRPSLVSMLDLTTRST